MKRLEDYINFALYEIPEVCNYIAVDDDGEVWAYSTLPEYRKFKDCEGYYHNGESEPYSSYIGVLLTEQQVKELEDRVVEMPKRAELNKLSNLHSLSNGEMTTLHTILTTLPSYYNEYVFTILQGLDSTINTLTTELEDERVARSKLSKELKLIAQELE